MTCQEGCRVEHLTVHTAACRSTQQDIIVLNKPSVRATRIASFLLPVPPLAGAQRICGNGLRGLSADMAALILANAGSSR